MAKLVTQKQKSWHLWRGFGFDQVEKSNDKKPADKCLTFLICNGSFQDKTTFSEGIYHD